MIATDLRLAFALLTRLPVGHAQGGDVARAVWAYPVAGAVVGAIGAAADWLARRAGMAPPLAAIWALAAMVLSTGGLHEDGLADTADGFGGGGTRERKLAIMRDSRIGSYGAIALLLSFGMRGAAIASLAHAAPGLIAVGALGRGAMILVLLALRPARAEGLAAPLATLRPRIAAAGLSIAVLAALLLPWRLAILAVALSALTAGVLAWLARAQIGGYTGDVLGATGIATECVLLSALAAT